MMRAHVAENQFNDYLEHAKNTEHASLIIHPPTTNVHLRWTGVSHREARKTRCARTLQKTNSTITYSTLQTLSTPALLYTQQTSTFGGQGLAAEKHVKHAARTLHKTNSAIT